MLTLLLSTDMHRHLNQIQSSMDNHFDQIKEVQASSAHLEQELQLTTQRQRSVARQSEEALKLLKQEFNNRQQHAEELEATLSASLRELKAAEQMLQV